VKVKRIIAILLFTIYASSAIGITMKLHYCQGRLANASLLDFDLKLCCPLNANHIPKACCRDQMGCRDQMVYQHLDKHNVAETISVTELNFLLIHPPFGNLAFNYNADSDSCEYLQISPERSCPEPIYLLNRALLI
jgi:hypothetical protein